MIAKQIKGNTSKLCRTKKLTDWASIKSAFSIAYTSCRTRTVISDEMAKIKQGNIESVKAYVQRFDAIYTELQLAINKESPDLIEARVLKKETKKKRD